MDCFSDFCSLVVGRVGVGILPTVKTIAAKIFDINNITIKICQNKKPYSNILFVTGKEDGV